MESRFAAEARCSPDKRDRLRTTELRMKTAPLATDDWLRTAGYGAERVAFQERRIHWLPRCDTTRKGQPMSEPCASAAQRPSPTLALPSHARLLLANERMKLTAPLGGLARYGVAGSAAACARATLRRTGAAAYPRCSIDPGTARVGAVPG